MKIENIKEAMLSSDNKKAIDRMIKKSKSAQAWHDALTEAAEEIVLDAGIDIVEPGNEYDAAMDYILNKLITQFKKQNRL